MQNRFSLKELIIRTFREGGRKWQISKAEKEEDILISNSRWNEEQKEEKLFSQLDKGFMARLFLVRVQQLIIMK